MNKNIHLRKLLSYKTLNTKYLCIPAPICKKLNLEYNDVMSIQLDERNNIIVQKVEIV